MSRQVSDFAQLDVARTQRTGQPEVVWAPGKSAEQIASIMTTLAQHQHAVLATRVEPEVYAAVRRHLPGTRKLHLSKRSCGFLVLLCSISVLLRWEEGSDCDTNRGLVQRHVPHPLDAEPPSSCPQLW